MNIYLIKVYFNILKKIGLSWVIPSTSQDLVRLTFLGVRSMLYGSYIRFNVLHAARQQEDFNTSCGPNLSVETELISWGRVWQQLRGRQTNDSTDKPTTNKMTL